MSLIPGDRRRVRIKKHPKMPTYEPAGIPEPRFPGCKRGGLVRMTSSCSKCRQVSLQAAGASVEECGAIFLQNGWTGTMAYPLCPACHE